MQLYVCVYTLSQQRPAIFVFFSMHKSTECILRDPGLRFARRKQILAQRTADFYFTFFQHLEESSFSKHLGAIRIALNVVCEILRCLYLHLCWESSAAPRGVFVNSIGTSFWTTSELKPYRFLVVRKDMLRICKVMNVKDELSMIGSSQVWFGAFSEAVVDFLKWVFILPVLQWGWIVSSLYGLPASGSTGEINLWICLKHAYSFWCACDFFLY